ncbi:MAG: MBL fold metallo-hydrolase [Acidobacteriota bacterium]|nr:MBL fold metallo-hydrolase [Acidobacteriota bacterium]
MAKVTFYGACGVVTGSCTHLSWSDGTELLVDCGMYQGPEQLEQLNWEPFAFDAHKLQAVILTHAHLDHIGLLPKLVKEGFSGPIHTTKAGRGLVSLILRDAAKIQEEQARYARRKKYSHHRDPKPLYTSDEARKALNMLVTQPFDKTFDVVPGIRLRFRRAGHLLGAASVEIEAKGSDGERRTWCFSGDIGRHGVPILKDPQPPEKAPAALLLESTYGDRSHPDSNPKEELAAIIEETYARGGMVIIPAFALGRSQEILYYMAELADEGRLDPKTVFLDSPMAIKATHIYDTAEAEHDAELQELDDTVDPLAAPPFNHAATVSQSKSLNHRRKPAVIISASGMATAGRVVHHLKNHLGDPNSSVVLVGYQAYGTRGRALQEGADTVGIHGRRVRVRAQIHSLSGLSAHGDREDLINWCKALPEPPQRIFLNHGEDPARKALAAELEEAGFPRPVLPLPGDSVPW